MYQSSWKIAHRDIWLLIAVQARWQPETLPFFQSWTNELFILERSRSSQHYRKIQGIDKLRLMNPKIESGVHEFSRTIQIFANAQLLEKRTKNISKNDGHHIFICRVPYGFAVSQICRGFLEKRQRPHATLETNNDIAAKRRSHRKLKHCFLSANEINYLALIIRPVWMELYKVRTAAVQSEMALWLRQN